MPRSTNKYRQSCAHHLRKSGLGSGKPERLSGNLSGCWSRRIDLEHRLVYKVIDGDLVVLQARYHHSQS